MNADDHEQEVHTRNGFAEDRNLRVEKARSRYDLAKLILASFTAICVIGLLGAVLVMLVEARQARHEIQDCIQPTGECAQRGSDNGARLGGAIVVCTNRLPPIVDKDVAFDCIIKEVRP